MATPRGDRTHKAEARREVGRLVKDPFWAAGTALYWGEGSKATRRLELANADAAALRLFMAWTQEFHDPTPEFVLSLNLHANNNEVAARQTWRRLLDLPEAQFTKTFIKPSGTGHRKNHLPHGVCRVRLRRSTDAWIRTMAWVAAMPEALGIPR